MFPGSAAQRTLSLDLSTPPRAAALRASCIKLHGGHLQHAEHTVLMLSA
jgi:hypothetical protein